MGNPRVVGHGGVSQQEDGSSQGSRRRDCGPHHLEFFLRFKYNDNAENPYCMILLSRLLQVVGSEKGRHKMKKRSLALVILLLLASLALGCTVFLEPEVKATLTTMAWEAIVTQTPFMSEVVAEETPVPTATVRTTPTPAPTSLPTSTPSPAPPTVPVASGQFDVIVFALDDAVGTQLYPSGYAFPAGARTVYAHWRYRDMGDETPYRAIWYLDETPIEVVEGVWDISVLRADGWAQFLILERSEGLQPGQYSLELYIAERLEQEAEFGILSAGPTTPPTNTPPSTRTPLPAVTSMPGQSAMEALLAAVSLEVVDDDGNTVAYASGSIVDHRGWILTNLHVLADYWTGELSNSQGEARVKIIRDPDELPDWAYIARLENWDADLDIAVLQVVSDAFGRPIQHGLSLPSVRLGDSDRTALPVLSLVTVIGFPSTGGGTVTVTQGQVAGRRCLEDGPWIKYTASTSPGSSGSMVLNEMGKLVGIHTGAMSDAGAGMGYMRPVNEVRALIAETLEGIAGTGALVVRGKERILRIVYTGSDGVSLRSEPSLQANSIDVLYAGETMHVVVPGKLNRWWAVYDGQSRVGWICELDLNGQRLAQVETRDFTSILQPGNMAEIMCLSLEEGHSCLNMRRTPGWRGKAEGDIITELDGGAMVEIVSGAREADGLIWWQVLEIATGLEGWVVEATVSGNRTLFPVR